MQATPTIERTTAGSLLWFFWRVGGNIIVYIAWVMIVLTTAPLPSLLDATVLLVVLLMIIARRIDIVRYSGRTTDGEPATLKDWRRYVAILIGANIAGELIAHQLGGSLLQ